MKLKGWSNVLKFTYVQTVKSKPFIISCAVLFALFTIMMMLGNYLPGAIKSEEKTIRITNPDGTVTEQKAPFEIDKAYILNKSGLNPDFSFLEQTGVKYELVTEEKNVSASTAAEVTAVISKTEDGRYEITMSRPSDTSVVSNNKCYPLLNALASAVTDANIAAHGIDLKDLAEASIPVSTKVVVDGEEPQSELGSVLASTAKMIISVLMFVAIFTYAQSTAQSIATEKSSRVMELLLTSVKPLAVIVGKVLAMTLVSLSSIVGVGGLLAVMFFAVAPSGSLGQIFGMVNTNDPGIEAVTSELSRTFGSVGAGDIALIALVFLMGFLFFSLIAGLIGATVSKIEDLQTAMQPFAIISVLGFYLAYLVPITGITDGGGNGGKLLVKLSYYLPICSPFSLPGAILSGEISGGETAAAVAVLAVFLILFAVFVAKVYESVILYTGTRLKIKDMVKIAKGS